MTPPVFVEPNHQAKPEASPKRRRSLLCRLGVHRPLRGHRHDFVDIVDGKTVYVAQCPCGQAWLVDSPFGFLGFKVRKTG